MTNYILFDDDTRISLRPLTFFRPVCEIRTGILTIRQKWEHYLDAATSVFTEPYLQQKFPLLAGADNILINGSMLPDRHLVSEIMSLPPDTVLQKGRLIAAIRLTGENLRLYHSGIAPALSKLELRTSVTRIVNTWDIPEINSQAIAGDFRLLTASRESAALPDGSQQLGSQLFIEPGASIEFSTFNTLHGPVYVGRHVHIMPGCHIEGPAALCDHSTLKMGSLIYAGTTIGPWCKAGGEISSSVMFGFSGKAHDGYLGNSVIAEWCNLGAGTTVSNLKNNYSTVKQWSYEAGKFVDTGLQFCGLVMGDHCKSGINTMFNSGTTAGVCSNIFGPGYQRNFIPSFAWGGTAGFRQHRTDEAVATAGAVYGRRGMVFGETEEMLMRTIARITSVSQFL